MVACVLFRFPASPTSAMVAPGLTPPDGEVSDFSVTTSSVKSAALAVDIVGIVLTTALVALRFTARQLVSGRVVALDDSEL